MIHYGLLGPAAVWRDGEAVELGSPQQRALFALHAAGRLRPTAGAVLPLEQAPQGYELLRSRKAVGKVILTMTPEAAAG